MAQCQALSASMAYRIVKGNQMTLHISEHDAISDEIIVRDMTKEELAQFEAEAKLQAEAKAAKETAATELKASAMAKLAALGLTEDEAKAIIG